MVVINSFNVNGQGPLQSFDFKSFQNVAKDCYLFCGDRYRQVFSNKYNDKKKYFLTLQQPNFCTDTYGPHAKLTNGYGSVCTGGQIFMGPCADVVLSICPYTSQLDPKRVPIFFPHNQKYIYNNDKIYDVIYQGGAHSNFLSQIVRTISKFNYRYIYYQNHLGLATDTNVSYSRKIQLVSKSKISVNHGLVFPNVTDIPRYKRYPNSANNKAMRQLWSDESVCGQKAMGQIKCRVFQAAFSRTLILNYFDSWNVIQNFFQPQKQFLYFYDFEDLQRKIKDITQNYSSYQHIIDNAYNKAINNYTMTHFINKYLK